MEGDDAPRHRSSPESRYPAPCCVNPDSNASSVWIESGRRRKFALVTSGLHMLTEFCEAIEPFILALGNLRENTTSVEKSEAIVSLPK
jgi:hypothetical protein